MLDRFTDNTFVEVEDVVKFRPDQRRNAHGQFAPEGTGGGTNTTLDASEYGGDEKVSDFWYADSAEDLKYTVVQDIKESMVDAGVEDWEFQTCFDEMDMSRNPTFEKWEGEKSGDEIRVITIDDSGNVYVRPLSHLNQDTLSANANFKNYTVEEARAALKDDYAKYGDAGTGEFHLAFDPAGAEVIKTGVVSDLVGNWATTSNDSDFIAHAIQETAKETFGLKDSADWTETQNSNFFKEVANFKTINANVLQTFVKSQYDATQTYFKNQGIDKVVLYRGIRGNKGLGEGSGFAEIALRPMSSWSTDLRIASRFSDDTLTLKGAIMRTSVNVKDIIAIPFTGVGCLNEQEMVIKGGVRKVDYQEDAYVEETGTFD